MNVALVGSRSFADERIVRAVIRRLIARNADVVVISGGARGADALAERTARELCRKPPLVFPAEWGRYGSPAAAFIRNQQIVDVSDEVVAFWDGSSRGTMDTVGRAIAAEKPVFVYLSSDRRWLAQEEILSLFQPVRRTQPPP